MSDEVACLHLDAPRRRRTALAYFDETGERAPFVKWLAD
jgi:hypothetical protein